MRIIIFLLFITELFSLEKKVNLIGHDFVFKFVSNREFNKVYEEAYKKCDFPSSYNDEEMAKEFNDFENKLIEKLRPKLLADYRIGSDYMLCGNWAGNQYHCAGVYSEKAHCLDFIELIILSLDESTKKPNDWLFHIACEGMREIIPHGQVLIWKKHVYIAGKKELLNHFTTYKLNRPIENIWEASNRNLKDRVIKFLKAGIDINAKDFEGNTPLHYVKSIELAQYLISQGANALLHNEYGELPYEVFSPYGKDQKIYEYLYDITYPLLAAVKNKDYKEINKLCKTINVNTFDKDLYESPLLLAVGENDLEGVKLLLKLGAKVNQQTRFKTSALSGAVAMENMEMCKFLLSNGAKIDTEVIMSACRLESEDYVNLLKRYDISFDVVDDDGDSPLHVVLNFNILKMLLEEGLDANKNGEIGTPLHHAAGRGLIKNVKLLLEHGADKNIVGFLDRTPIDDAVEQMEFRKDDKEKKKFQEIIDYLENYKK